MGNKKSTPQDEERPTLQILCANRSCKKQLTRFSDRVYRPLDWFCDRCHAHLAAKIFADNEKTARIDTEAVEKMCKTFRTWFINAATEGGSSAGRTCTCKKPEKNESCCYCRKLADPENHCKADEDCPRPLTSVGSECTNGHVQP